MSILDSLQSAFSGLGSKKDSFVGIDIGSSAIKVVQLKKEKGRILLDTYGEVALGPYQKEDGVAGELTNLEIEPLTKAIKNLLSQANVTATNALISISSATSLIFILKVPQISQRELSGVIQNEARKYIPVPLTEVSLDYWMIPKNESYSDDHSGSSKDSTIDVLVAAVRNEVVTRYNTVSKSLSFNDIQYEIETFSALRGSLKHELSPVMIIDLGASGTRMSIVEHGVVRKFRAISRGSAYISSSLQKSFEIPFKEAEAMKREIGLDKSATNSEAYNIIEVGTEYIFSELKNVIFDFEKEYKKPISKIILTGGGALLKNIQPTIEARFNINTVHANPFSKALSPEFLEDVLRQAGPEFAVATGLALQGLE